MSAAVLSVNRRRFTHGSAVHRRYHAKRFLTHAEPRQPPPPQPPLDQPAAQVGIQRHYILTGV
jgi:hypothetical protein